MNTFKILRGVLQVYTYFLHIYFPSLCDIYIFLYLQNQKDSMTLAFKGTDNEPDRQLAVKS